MSKEQIPLTPELLEKLYEKKAILLIEQNDGKFYQVEFNEDQFKVFIHRTMTIFPHEVNNGIARAELKLGKSLPGYIFENFRNTK